MDRVQWLARLAVTVAILTATGSHAIYLDEDQNITLTARIYSQAAIRAQDSQVDTVPTTFSGQLVQQRNFFNPEVDAKLTSYFNWMKGGSLGWMAPDDLRFRIAAWGFYDGIYDYGSSQFNESQKQINDTFNNNVPIEPATDNRPRNFRQAGWFVRGQNIKICSRKDPNTGECLPNREIGTQFSDVFPGYSLYVPRSIYQNQARVNELYLSYSKGPFFLRIGKQSISWGESDTIALLDQSNPFDLTLGAPGFFEDIDEARIPLYTIRSSYNLFDSIGPFSSGFIEGYWVPGFIDATTSITPLLAASPYSPRGQDPQLSSTAVPGGVFPATFQFLFFDHLLRDDISSSRWGIRFQTIVNRFLTLQTWVYRTYPQAPVPVKIGPQPGSPQGATIDIGPAGQSTNFFIISLEHKPVMVYGLAGTFFSEWLDGIFRLNAPVFEHEAGFIPEKNLRVCPTDPQNPRPCPEGGDGNRPNAISSPGAIPYANVLRYEIGFDRFFFARFLNPTNSFILSTSAVGSYNLSETDNSKNDFHFNGQLKPGKVNVFRVVENPETGQQEKVCTTDPCTQRVRGAFQDDFVNANKLDAQFQMTFQTDYMHGRLQPRLTLIQFVRGTFAMHPTLIYRWNDSLLFQADYQYISGAYQSLGFFRDRDQVSFRVTYQLN